MTYDEARRRMEQIRERMARIGTRHETIEKRHDRLIDIHYKLKWWWQAYTTGRRIMRLADRTIQTSRRLRAESVQLREEHTRLYREAMQRG